MDVAARGVAGGTADVDLFVEEGQKVLGGGLFPAGTDHLGAPGRQYRLRQGYRRIATFRLRIVHL